MINHQVISPLNWLRKICSFILLLILSIGIALGISIRPYEVSGTLAKNEACQKLHSTESAGSGNFAKVILYRPDNQLSRKYRLHTNIKESFNLARKEVVYMDAHTNTFKVEVSAVGHKDGIFTFKLTENKIHYYRVQDRNNYSGFRAYLEVIEVTEETFRREQSE
jgi:hypothetical protein